MHVYRSHGPVRHLYPDKSCKSGKQRGKKSPFQLDIISFTLYEIILQYSLRFTSSPAVTDIGFRLHVTLYGFKEAR